VWLIGALLLTTAAAQDSSLLRREGSENEKKAITLENSSYFYRKPIPLREIRKYDLVTIRVEETARAMAEGEMESRNSSLYDAVLSDWISLDGLKAIRPNSQSDGDPHIKGKLSQLYRKKSELETVESLKFRITAKVVDKRPNGNLVLEAHKIVRNNEEIWEYSLTGICRAADIDPDTNEILSENLAETSIFKRERGHVRDGYRRGWFLRWFDTFHPF